ncbi:MAG: hypothetical protein IIC89_05110, partial [Chloroflexi bacterium]|nr:hypothetical protein [Chloroflexota bacterium]
DFLPNGFETTTSMTDPDNQCSAIGVPPPCATLLDNEVYAGGPVEQVLDRTREAIQDDEEVRDLHERLTADLKRRQNPPDDEELFDHLRDPGNRPDAVLLFCAAKYDGTEELSEDLEGEATTRYLARRTAYDLVLAELIPDYFREGAERQEYVNGTNLTAAADWDVFLTLLDEQRSQRDELPGLPTGLAVVCQNERCQLRNKESAMRVLEARLLERELVRQAEERAKIKGEHVAAGWGNQIRSYVLHPYKMVKDHRTGFETSAAEAVLEGDLDPLITAFLKSTMGSANA